MSSAQIIDVHPRNVKQYSLFCIQNKKSQGYRDKLSWFEQRHEEGLKIKILEDENGKPLSYIEYIPIEFAWRPVKGEQLYFIHCMYTGSKKDRNLGYAELLVKTCENEAEKAGLKGVAVMTSSGVWLAGKSLFEKMGYVQVDKKGRFELMYKAFDNEWIQPVLNDWEAAQSRYQGWHLLYAKQCPWHSKSANDLQKLASEEGVDLQVQVIESAVDAQFGPSGFGTFALLHEGKLLEDHYISATRFRNILKKELR